MRISGFLFCLLVLSQFSAAQVENPFPEFSNWKISTEFPVYTPDNLWDYINGAATVYLQYGFTDLRMAEYSKGRKSITVEIYHHNSRENAFGIYARERYPDYYFMDIGAQGYQQGPVLNFLKGEYYVKMQSGSDKSFVIKALIDLAKVLAQSLEGDNSFPKIIKYFPDEGKIANSEKFIAVNFLGHEFFDDGFTAQYKIAGEEFTLFISQRENPEDCRMTLEKYLEFTGQDLPLKGQGNYLIKDRYNGNVNIYWINDVLMGITGTGDEDIIEKYLELMKITSGN